jgi:hypothetical protein
MKRLKKILKWTGIVLAGLAAIGLVVNACWVWSTDTRLENQLAAIREAGDPLSIAELARSPIAPDNNAAVFLRRAEADVEAIQRELSGVCSGWPLLPMTSEDQRVVKAALDAYPHLIPLLEHAATCPDYDAQLDYTLPPKAFNMQLLEVARMAVRAARVFRARALMLTNEGNCDEAVRTALLMLWLARGLDRNPTLMSYLGAIAIRHEATEAANLALQTGRVSERSRTAVEAELALQDKMEGYEWMIKSHRAFVVDRIGASSTRNFWLVRRAIWNERESAFLDEMEASLALMRKGIPYREADEAINAIKDNSWFGQGRVGAREMGVHWAEPIIVRARATMRTLRVLNALQGHVPPGSKETPNLSELGLPAEAITDPFTGEPLHVKKTPRGWLVYSVGQNFRDDGGKLDDAADGDVGVGPPPEAKPVEKGQAGKGNEGGG